MEAPAAARVRRSARPPAGETPLPGVAHDGPGDGAAAPASVGPEPAAPRPDTVEPRTPEAATAVPPVGPIARRRARLILTPALGAEAQGPRVHAATPRPLAPLQGALDARDPAVDAALAAPVAPVGGPVGGGPAPAAPTGPAVVTPAPRPYTGGHTGGPHRPARRLHGPVAVRTGPTPGRLRAQEGPRHERAKVVLSHTGDARAVMAGQGGTPAAARRVATPLAGAAPAKTATKAGDVVRPRLVPAGGARPPPDGVAAAVATVRAAIVVDGLDAEGPFGAAIHRQGAQTRTRTAAAAPRKVRAEAAVAEEDVGLAASRLGRVGSPPARPAIATARVPVAVARAVAPALPSRIAGPALVPTQAAEVDRCPLAAMEAPKEGVTRRRCPPVPVALRGPAQEGAVTRRVAPRAIEAPTGTAVAETLPFRAATMTAAAAGAGVGPGVAPGAPAQAAAEEAQAEGARAPVVEAGAASPGAGAAARPVGSAVATTLVALAAGVGAAAQAAVEGRPAADQAVGRPGEAGATPAIEASPHLAGRESSVLLRLCAFRVEADPKRIPIQGTDFLLLYEKIIHRELPETDVGM